MNHTGATVCINCPIDTYRQVGDLPTTCSACPPGTHQPTAGSTSCILIVNGYSGISTTITTTLSAIFTHTESPAEEAEEEEEEAEEDGDEPNWAIMTWFVVLLPVCIVLFFGAIIVGMFSTTRRQLQTDQALLLDLSLTARRTGSRRNDQQPPLPRQQPRRHQATYDNNFY
jgi:Ca2+/H+ antiporter